MIQDTLPEVLNNAYEPKPLLADSLIFSFIDDTVLLKDSPEQPFPCCAELGIEQQDVIYLFEVHGTDCFLAKPESIKTHEGYHYESLFGIMSLQPQYLAFACVTAKHLNSWYAGNRFCGTCGETLRHSTKERMLFCEHCESTVYPRISPAIIVGIYRGDELLLTRYANRPYRNYALIAGFVEIGETVEDAVKREVMEEVGLEIKNLKYYKSQPWGISESLLMGFFAELSSEHDIVLDTIELSEAVWVHKDDIQATLDHVSLTNEMIVHFKNSKPGSLSS